MEMWSCGLVLWQDYPYKGVLDKVAFRNLATGILSLCLRPSLSLVCSFTLILFSLCSRSLSLSLSFSLSLPCCQTLQS